MASIESQTIDRDKGEIEEIERERERERDWKLTGNRGK